MPWLKRAVEGLGCSSRLKRLLVLYNAGDKRYVPYEITSMDGWNLLDRPRSVPNEVLYASAPPDTPMSGWYVTAVLPRASAIIGGTSG